MNIRSMKIEDVFQIEQLMNQLGYPSSVTQLQNRFQKIMDLHDYQTLVAEIDSTIVGLIGMAKQFAYEFDGPYVRVMALVVHEDYRGMKIGHNLMQAAENWAVENECVAVTLNSGNRPERIGAHQFYERLGYVGKSTGFSKILY